MTDYLGDFSAGATVRIWWNTNAVAGESITRATDGSIRIYKDGSDTQRSSSAGITDSEDADGLTGVHRLSIDLSDNSHAGFYAAGSDYAVVLVGAEIDGKTINHVLAQFSINNRSTAAIKAITDAISTANITYAPSYNVNSKELTMYRGDTKVMVIAGLDAGLTGASSVVLSARRAGAEGSPLAQLTGGVVVSDTSLSFVPTTDFYTALPNGYEYEFDIQLSLASAGGIFSPVQKSKLTIIDDVTK